MIIALKFVTRNITTHLHDTVVVYGCRIGLFVLMYPINSVEFLGNIATSMSESKAEIVSLIQNFITQDTQSYMMLLLCQVLSTCNWFLCT